MSPQINKILIAAALAFAGMVSHAAGIQWNVPMHHDWWWNAPEKPQITVCAANADTLPARCNVTLSIETDTHRPVTSMSQAAMIAAGDSVNFTFDFNLMPGFYGCTVTGNGAEVKKFNIGYEPENIVSLPDAQPDFDEFWQRTLNELAAVAPEYRLTEDKEKSGNGGKIYVVSMKSLGGVEIKGYLTMPDKASKSHRLPVVVHYMGYGSKPWHAEPREDARCIDFVLSTRGQGLNQPGNQYGEWATYGIGDREQYYYRGAFMDLIRAVDFVCSLLAARSRHPAHICRRGKPRGRFHACGLRPRQAHSCRCSPHSVPQRLSRLLGDSHLDCRHSRQGGREQRQPCRAAQNDVILRCQEFCTAHHMPHLDGSGAARSHMPATHQLCRLQSHFITEAICDISRVRAHRQATRLEQPHAGVFRQLHHPTVIHHASTKNRAGRNIPKISCPLSL